MLNQNRPNAPITKSQLKKLACAIGIAGITTLISFPALAKLYKLYPPLALFQPSAHRSYPYRNSDKTIADTLSQNSQFANLYDELKQAGLLQDLKQGNYTIFAPTNEAFNALPKSVFERYSQNRLRVLKYHLVSSQITAKDAKELNGKLVTTVEGDPIKITVEGEDTVKLNDATGKHPSIKASNGVIIEVNKVLLPRGF